MEQDNPPHQLQELASNSVLPNYQTGYLSTEFLCQIINKVTDPIFVKNRRHEWILINDAFCRFLGRDRQELIGKSDYDFFPSSEADIFWEKDEFIRIPHSVTCMNAKL
jgi:PAS domain-containing protein